VSLKSTERRAKDVGIKQLTDQTNGCGAKGEFTLSIDFARSQLSLDFRWTQRFAKGSIIVVDSSSAEAHRRKAHEFDGSRSGEDDQVSL
jgi:hypothetical protein